MKPEDLVFIDTETTGLHPTRHEIWEVAIGLYAPNAMDYVGAPIESDSANVGDWGVRSWQIAPDRLADADPMALKIGQYHARFSEQKAKNRHEVAIAVERLTRGKHIVGAVPSFDEERLRHLLHAENLCPTWHYHLVDIEVMVLGYLYALGRATCVKDSWSSDELSKAVGVDPDDFERHSAAGDVAWCIAQWEAITTTAPALAFDDCPGLS